MVQTLLVNQYSSTPSGKNKPENSTLTGMPNQHESLDGRRGPDRNGHL